MFELMHGGPDAQGVVAHDFSTNGNACGPCPAALEALQAADASRYPDPHYLDLRERLAGLHGVEAHRIVIAASASEFIGRVTAAVSQGGGGRVRLPRHGYGDYARAASSSTRAARSACGWPSGLPGSQHQTRSAAQSAVAGWKCQALAARA